MNRRSLMAGCCVAAGLAVASVFGYVGVNDRCPWPTSYPPAGAGWAEVNNPNFEGGFTNYVANQWIGWKDDGLAGQVHYVGDDRHYEGNYSQKLILPQPDRDWQEAGIYQQIYVVPGATYTATVRIYLDFWSANGDDLLGWLGLDPWGQDSGDGSGMEWSVNVATQHTWIEATISATASLPVMTIGLKATRKWPWHGDGAKVYFDRVTFTGPVPTDPPPGPGVDPVDPETLIPDTIGPNLVGNPSFEGAYSDGVSNGWNKWWTSGSGEWRRSIRIGKVGGGKYDCLGEQENADLNPKTILLYGGTPPPGNPNDPGGFGVYGTVDAFNIHPHLDNTIILGRPAVDDNWGTYKTDPRRYGRQLADQLHLVEQVYPRIDCWQGVNEPGTHGSEWQLVIDFEKAYTERAHELGMKTCVLNLSTGSPGNIWQMVNESYDPHCGELLAIADYIGHHVYGGPSDQFMVTNQNLNGACSFALRPRRFKDMYDRREWRFPPVIATEGSTWGAWHGTYSPDQIGNDLMTMGEYMNANNFWCGYTNFVCGASCSWIDFEIVGQGTIVQDVGQWNYNHPADAKDGYYSQMFGAGNCHPKTLSELTPAGYLNGGVNRQITGLIPGEGYLLICWMKYEFRGLQPAQLKFYLGVDHTGQTANGNAGTIDWGDDQIVDKAPVHETFTHVWRTFTAAGSTASFWLRASHPVSNPSFKFYVDLAEVRQLDDAPPGPYIEVLPEQIDVATDAGGSPPNGSFNIRNSGAGTINYSFDRDCAWLALSPGSGASSGETDTIQIIYDTDELSTGTYHCQITVTAPEALNSPLDAPHVTITITTVRPDFDGDGDVDQEDFGYLQACYNGPGVPQQDPYCAGALLDDDDDVDQDDFSIFQNCFSGANVPPSPGCAGGS